MDTILFGSVTVQHAIIVLAVVVGGGILFGIIRSLGRSKDSPHVQAVRCGACDWEGRVSRYAGRCPRCNRPLGRQTARKA